MHTTFESYRLTIPKYNSGEYIPINNLGVIGKRTTIRSLSSPIFIRPSFRPPNSAYMTGLLLVSQCTVHFNIIPLVFGKKLLSFKHLSFQEHFFKKVIKLLLIGIEIMTQLWYNIFAIG